MLQAPALFNHAALRRSLSIPDSEVNSYSSMSERGETDGFGREQYSRHQSPRKGLMRRTNSALMGSGTEAGDMTSFIKQLSAVERGVNYRIGLRRRRDTVGRIIGRTPNITGNQICVDLLLLYSPNRVCF